jgi:hypothetical protein
MEKQTNDALRELLAKDQIAGVINRLFVGTDARDWAAVKACFEESVLFDVTSMPGGQASRMTPEQIVQTWETGLKPIQAIHHQTGNLSVELKGDEAAATCYGIAYHYRRTRLGKNTRVFVGSYEFHLKRRDDAWRIGTFCAKLKFIDGNLELEKEL